ncbi:MAG: MBL fold metallo-hydrolase [Deltaproteobacteria bacterium]|nr:MBL fold metallo-hydrolase [Deltaproteobacteria bacterium]
MRAARSTPSSVPPALLALLALAADGCCAFSSCPYEGPTRAPFVDGRFYNQVPSARHSIGDLLRFFTQREQPEWQDVTDAVPGPPPPERVGEGGLRVTFVGHSTVLLQLDGLNLLADPIWSDRAGPVEWAGQRRHRPPGLRFEDLPPIDAVLVSHNHYDHLDVATLQRLQDEHHPVFYTGLGNAAFLRREGVWDVLELDWWDEVRLARGVRLTFVPAQHFSGRGLCDQGATLWGGFVVEGPAGVVYFAGDTGLGPHFTQIRERFGAPRLAVLPIGSFQPRWFMSVVHMGPDDAVEAHRRLDAQATVAIHFGTFGLADDGQEEPVELLGEALAEAGVSSGTFRVLAEGEGWDVPPLPGASVIEAPASDMVPEPDSAL